MTRIILLLVVGLSIPWHNLVAGGNTWRENTDLLPPFCKERAKGITTPGMRGVHHYCGALFTEARARVAVNLNKRNRLLQKAAGGMKAYAQKDCQSGCALYPDGHTRLGRALSELGLIAEAIKHYKLAFQEKRNYTPAYAGMSDLYVELNQPDEARKVLEAGLKARPGSRMLQRRIQKLETPQ